MLHRPLSISWRGLAALGATLALSVCLLDSTAYAQGGAGGGRGAGRGGRGRGAGAGNAPGAAPVEPAVPRGIRGGRGATPQPGAAAATPVPGSAPADDRPYHYPPQRQVDIQHQAVDITPDFRKRTIDASTKIDFTVLTQPLEHLDLDAVDLDIHSAKINGQDCAFTTQNDQVIITLKSPLAVGSQGSVEIAYHAEPKHGVYFRTKEMGYKPEDEHLFTQGEEEETREWMPCYDHPNDKLTTEITAHFPEDMICAANGLMIDESVSNGIKTSHWKQTKEMSNYLFALVIGKFYKLEGKHGDLPLTFYVPASQAKYAQTVFDITNDVIGFEEEFTGVKFPWEKYGQVFTNDFVAGGMENASLTIYADTSLHPKEYEPARNSDSLVAHETMHQWTGDLVTCKDWTHTWLNEGFATYGANMYLEHKEGHDAFQYFMWNGLRTLANTEVTNPLPIVYNRYRITTEQFGVRGYQKPGWVIHMLRMQLGSDLFHECFKTYLNKFAYQPVETDDFRRTFEDVSHQSLYRFFDQWFHHGGMPDLGVAYSWDAATGTAHVTVSQNQPISNDIPVYYLPTKVRFNTADGPVDKAIVIDEKTNEFTFALPAAPLSVRFDPELTLMARVTFPLPTPMLMDLAGRKDDVVGRCIAVQQLQAAGGADAVAKLAEMVKSDPFYGVRVDAARALGQLRTNDDAFKALMAAREQSDLRAANAVTSAIGGFTNDEAMKNTLDIVNGNGNLLTKISAIGTLPKYALKTDITPILRKELAEESYHNEVSSAAIAAMRDTADPKYIDDLIKVLKGKMTDYPDRAYVQGLSAVANLAAPLPKTDEREHAAFDLILEAAQNKNNQRIATGAIQALAVLGDRRALSTLQGMDGGRQGDAIQTAARNAAEALQNATVPPVPGGSAVSQELTTLRTDVDRLSRELETMRNQRGGGGNGGGNGGGRGRRGGRGGAPATADAATSNTAAQ